MSVSSLRCASLRNRLRYDGVLPGDFLDGNPVFFIEKRGGDVANHLVISNVFSVIGRRQRDVQRAVAAHDDFGGNRGDVIRSSCGIRCGERDGNIVPRNLRSG